MKLESLIIIFVILVMPMTMVLKEYVDNKIEILETEMSYDTKLFNSTADAIKAYQLNNVNNALGDVTNERIEGIEAAVNTFYNSLASNFNYTGYNSSVMDEYVPAVVFTSYDGYYIYSPYNNALTDVADDQVDTSYSEKGELTNGLKPYVSYSSRYTTTDGKIDVVITYTLGNYITIQGKTANNAYVYDYGYLYTIAGSKNDEGIFKDGETYWYNGVQFTANDTEELKEKIPSTDPNSLALEEYSYVKINGKKYYLDENYYTDRTGTTDLDVNGTTITFNNSSAIFFISEDGSRNYSQTKGYSSSNYTTDNETFLAYYMAIKYNKSAYEYYKNAYEFSMNVLKNGVTDYKDKCGTTINGGYGLSSLRTENSEYWAEDNPDINSIQDYGSFAIFSGTIEESSSNFNQHRRAIIRYVIETNLSASISGFASQAGTSFVMPKISDDDWEIIQNEVCAIGFLQGLNLSAKRYNGYAVVSNSLTKDWIGENDIYILTDTASIGDVYCRVNDSNIYGRC